MFVVFLNSVLPISNIFLDNIQYFGKVVYKYPFLTDSKGSYKHSSQDSSIARRNNAVFK